MINIGDKYQHIRTGNQYEVVDCGKQTSPNGTYEDYVVWYCKVGETAKAYPRLESHFLDSFKPYEPVYEYQWVLIKNGEVNRFDWGEWYSESDVRGKGKWVKIEETKRERK